MPRRGLPELHRQAQELALDYIEGVGPTQWNLDTPCSEWDVRSLVNHITAGNRWVGALAHGGRIEQIGEAFGGDLLGGDPVAAFRASMDEACAVFEAPGAMEETFHLSYGDAPGALFASRRFVDVLIHAWDVAVATGQEATLDDALVHRCYDIVEPAKDDIAKSPAFGPRVEVDDDADTQVKLLALLGRRS